MSHSVAETKARRRAIVPDDLGPDSRTPTEDERIVFRHFALPAKNRKIAIYSARRSYPQARNIYRMIARSLA